MPSVHRFSRVLVMLRAFIDETGNDPKEPVFNFAGWVSKVTEWDHFSDAWHEELHRTPPIEYFKHHEAKSQTGQFEGWSRADCDEKILSLAKVIVKHDVYGAATGVRNQVIAGLLKKAIPSVKTVRSVLHASRPYDWCFHSIISIILQHQVNQGEKDKVDFIFDEGDRAFEDCARLYREYREKWPFPPAMGAIAGMVSTGNNKLIMPLQAADLLVGGSTAKLRGQNTDIGYRLLATEKKILFCPIRWADPEVAGYADIIQLLNIVWSTKLLGRLKDKK